MTETYNTLYPFSLSYLLHLEIVRAHGQESLASILWSGKGVFYHNKLSALVDRFFVFGDTWNYITSWLEVEVTAVVLSSCNYTVALVRAGRGGGIRRPAYRLVIYTNEKMYCHNSTYESTIWTMNKI